MGRALPGPVSLVRRPGGCPWQTQRSDAVWDRAGPEAPRGSGTGLLRARGTSDPTIQGEVPAPACALRARSDCGPTHRSLAKGLASFGTCYASESRLRAENCQTQQVPISPRDIQSPGRSLACRARAVQKPPPGRACCNDTLKWHRPRGEWRCLGLFFFCSGVWAVGAQAQGSVKNHTAAHEP